MRIYCHSNTVSLHLHGYYDGGFREIFYLLKVHVTLLKKEKYEGYEYIKINGYDKFNNEEFLSDIKHFRAKGIRYFRHDYKNGKTDEFIVAVAEYLDNFQENTRYHNEDLETIKRILNSIQFLPQGAAKPAKDE